MLLGHGRWLYALALLQLLGGPLVVSVVMLLGEPGADERADVCGARSASVVAMNHAIPADASGEEITESETLPWQKPVTEPPTQGKSKTQWSVESASRVRIYPPESTRLEIVEPRVTFWKLGAGPPAPPPRWV